MICSNLIALSALSQDSNKVVCYNKQELQIIADSLLKGQLYRQDLISTKKEIALLETENKALLSTLDTSNKVIIAYEKANKECNEAFAKSQEETRIQKSKKKNWIIATVSSVGVSAVLFTLLLLK